MGWIRTKTPLAIFIVSFIPIFTYHFFNQVFIEENHPSFEHVNVSSSTVIIANRSSTVIISNRSYFSERKYTEKNATIGYFDDEGYILVNSDVSGIEAWEHFCHYGHREGRPIVVRSGDRFFRGLFDSSNYFRVNSIHAYYNVSNVTIVQMDPWEHYLNHGHTNGWLIGVSGAKEIVLPKKIHEFCELTFQKKMPRLIVITHNFGGGTELFESEMVKSTTFEFFIFRISWNEALDLIQFQIFIGLAPIFSSLWVQATEENVASFFSCIDFEGIIVTFLHPIKTVVNFLTQVNKPILYALHDHHAILYSIENEMHLNCEDTRLTGTIHLFWNMHRFRNLEILRRSIIIVTPSLRNVEIYATFFPELIFLSAPNRLQDTQPCQLKVTHPFQTASFVGNKPVFKIVVIGHLSKGKGGWIVKDVAEKGFAIKLWTIYHIGTSADFGSGKNNIVQLGSFRDTAHLQQMLDEVQPNFIWFPAIRHESYCYILDMVINLRFPIVASSTGAFPERLKGRAYTWIAKECFDSNQWIFFFMSISSHLRYSTNSSSWGCTTPLQYDFPSFLDVLEWLSVFISLQGTYNSSGFLGGEPAEWIQFLALNPKLVFTQGKIDKKHATTLLSLRKMQKSQILKSSLVGIRFPAPTVTGPQLPLRSSRNASYDTLLPQWSAESSVLVWEYLAQRIPQYTIWYSTECRVHRHQSQKAALLVISKYSDIAFPVSLNIMYNLGSGWKLYVLCQYDCTELEYEFKGSCAQFIDSRAIISYPKYQSLLFFHEVMMSPNLWSFFMEEYILVFQVDSLVVKPGIDAFVDLGFPFLGALKFQGLKTGMQTPNGWSIAGSFSLRSRSAMETCLSQISPNKVNLYRENNNLSHVPHKPEQSIFMPEDIFFVHALEMLNYPFPPTTEQMKFCVQDLFYANTMAISGFNKPWHLTTAQLALVLQDNPLKGKMYLNDKHNF